MELGTFKRDFKKFVSLFPSGVQKVIEKKAYLAGGALRSLALQQRPKDYDLFFIDRESACIVRDEAMRLPAHSSVTDNAATVFVEEMGIPFQIITKVAGMPESVIEKFDFTCNMNYFFPALDYGELKYGNDIEARNLEFNPKATTPLSTLVRLPRFLSEGWYITPNSLGRIGVAISKLHPIDSAERLQQCGVNEYSGRQVGKLDFSNVMAPSIEALRERRREPEYGDFRSGAALGLDRDMMNRLWTASNLPNITFDDSVNIAVDPMFVPGAVQAVEQPSQPTSAPVPVRRRGHTLVDALRDTVARPEPTRSPEVAGERTWTTGFASEVTATPALTRERLVRAVEAVRNAEISQSNETPF